MQHRITGFLTNVREFYERVAGHDVNLPPFERTITKPPVPTLALWSRKDGIVAPSAARGRRGEVDKSVEIDTHHMGEADLKAPRAQGVCGMSAEGLPCIGRRWAKWCGR